MMIAQQLHQIQLDKWPALVAASVVCLAFLLPALLKRIIPLWRVPLIGHELGGYEKRRRAYQTNAQSLYAEGYELVRHNLHSQEFL
jgi:hypothetical protein